jgi:hypothetical protein
MSAQPYAGLRKKLVAVDDVEMGGVCEVTVYRNPDGPEAAEAISTLLKRVGELEGGLRLARMWCEDVAMGREVSQAVARRSLKCIDAALNSDASTQTVGGE